jgi:hypothetical protein
MATPTPNILPCFFLDLKLGTLVATTHAYITDL